MCSVGLSRANIRYTTTRAFGAPGLSGRLGFGGRCGETLVPRTRRERVSYALGCASGTGKLLGGVPVDT
jgi:hypothetical protein